MDQDTAQSLPPGAAHCSGPVQGTLVLIRDEVGRLEKKSMWLHDLCRLALDKHASPLTGGHSCPETVISPSQVLNTYMQTENSINDLERKEGKKKKGKKKGICTWKQFCQVLLHGWEWLTVFFLNICFHFICNKRHEAFYKNWSVVTVHWTSVTIKSGSESLG